MLLCCQAIKSDTVPPGVRSCKAMGQHNKKVAVERVKSSSSGGRPRDNAARTAILEAANAILEEKGIAGFTIEAVAMRASVAKTTIYRWWPSKGSLAVAGFLAATAPKITYPDSGSVLTDLVGQLRRVAT